MQHTLQGQQQPDVWRPSKDQRLRIQGARQLRAVRLPAARLDDDAAYDHDDGAHVHVHPLRVDRHASVQVRVRLRQVVRERAARLG